MLLEKSSAGDSQRRHLCRLTTSKQDGCMTPARAPLEGHVTFTNRMLRTTAAFDMRYERSGTLQAMQRDLRRTIEPYRNDAGAGANGGIPIHLAIAPGPGTEPPWHTCIQSDRDGTRQADLPAVRMATQHEIETGMRGLPVDFRRV